MFYQTGGPPFLRAPLTSGVSGARKNAEGGGGGGHAGAVEPLAAIALVVVAVAVCLWLLFRPGSIADRARHGTEAMDAAGDPTSPDAAGDPTAPDAAGDPTAPDGGAADEAAADRQDPSLRRRPGASDR